MRSKFNQSGFGTIEAVIIILVLGILGGVGWFVYAHNKSSSTTTAVSQTKTTTSSAVAKNNKLYISEWGVSLPYSGDTSLTYGPANQDNMNLSSTELTAANSKCSATMGGIGGVMRAKVGEVAHFSGHDAATDINLTGQQYAAKYPNETVVLSGYAYTSYIRTDDACASDPSASQTVKAINSLFQ